MNDTHIVVVPPSVTVVQSVQDTPEVDTPIQDTPEVETLVQSTPEVDTLVQDTPEVDTIEDFVIVSSECESDCDLCKNEFEIEVEQSNSYESH